MHQARRSEGKIVKAIAASGGLLRSLAQVTTREKQEEFSRAVLQVLKWDLVGPEYDEFMEKFFSEFCQWTSWDKQAIPPAITLQHMAREIAKSQYRRDKRDFLKDLGIDGKAEPEDLKSIYVDRLRQCYPPLGSYVAESRQEAGMWNGHLLSANPPDRRVPRKPAAVLDPSRLQRTIQEDESCKIYDRQTGELIGVVIRNFCPSAGVTAWADGVARQATELKRSSRKEDPGQLVIQGYSAGARSRPCFGWAKNLLSRKHSQEAVKSFDYESSSVFALFWNMCKHRLPDSVIGDIEGYMERTGISRMDGNGLMAGDGDSAKGHYKVSAGAGASFTVCEADLAPPTGVFAANYSRAIHYEHQPHKYCISWTLTRSDPPSKGGNFFMSQWGIRVLQAPNTVIVWIPASPHGTSLQRLNPLAKKPKFLQTGLAIITSPRIAKVWSDYEKGKIQLEAAVEKHQKIENGEVEYK